MRAAPMHLLSEIVHGLFGITSASFVNADGCFADRTGPSVSRCKASRILERTLRHQRSTVRHRFRPLRQTCSVGASSSHVPPALFPARPSSYWGLPALRTPRPAVIDDAADARPDGRACSPGASVLFLPREVPQITLHGLVEALCRTERSTIMSPRRSEIRR